jgi:hypothetical protein
MDWHPSHHGKHTGSTNELQAETMERQNVGVDSNTELQKCFYDIWNKTMQADRIGSLGLEEKFYYTLSRLFISLMAGPDISRF